ncbi:type II secretion system protein [Candidatus Saccharibacteria bacterium]|nr:type II secretion system protein [Candidatus Saccharibacteria bacterium]
MRQHKLINQKQEGFTLVELMIASAVFATVLLLCTYGLLEIGRSYYKGATISRTQETARLITDDVIEAIQFGGGGVFGNEADGWYCIGNKRYSFTSNVQRRDTAPVRSHVLMSETVPACSSTSDKNTSVDTSTLTGTDTKELMNMRMRLTRFSITPLNNDLYEVTVRVVSGDNDMLETISGETVCRNDRILSQFCAVSQLTTIARKRV